ncbi:MBL fold metallo-hydrolase [Luteipulveratus mongoliensis]|nr:MBL fold metallo-hydrolase [Luteipulveratus mongoliensis]
MPTVELQHLAGRVWLYPHDPDPDAVRGSVAVIADERGSVVVDAGHSPALAREVQRALRAAGLPSPRWLVYTHHHWDHTWGACAWDGVEIIGHASATTILEGEARRPWSAAYLREQVAENPRLSASFAARARAVDDWSKLRVLPPHRTFDTSLELPTGVQVRHVGGQHAPDSSIVIDPESRVALLGDCFYPPPLHLRSPDDTADVPMLLGLLEEQHEWYVDAHDSPRTLAQARAALGF